MGLEAVESETSALEDVDFPSSVRFGPAVRGGIPGGSDPGQGHGRGPRLQAALQPGSGERRQSDYQSTFRQHDGGAERRGRLVPGPLSGIRGLRGRQLRGDHRLQGKQFLQRRLSAAEKHRLPGHHPLPLGRNERPVRRQFQLRLQHPPGVHHEGRILDLRRPRGGARRHRRPQRRQPPHQYGPDG